LVKKEKLIITILFIVSALFGTVLIFLFEGNIRYISGFFCYILAIFCLPKINNTKQDIRDLDTIDFYEVSGTIESLFPEKEGKDLGKWIVIINSNKKLYEYLLNKKLDLNAKTKVRVKLTKNTKIPVQIEAISDEK